MMMMMMMIADKNDWQCKEDDVELSLPAEIKQVISFIACPCGGGSIMEAHLEQVKHMYH